jgi:uncharacterized membrane protein YfcA
MQRRSNFGPTLLLGVVLLCLYAMLNSTLVPHAGSDITARLLRATQLPALVVVAIGFAIGCYGTIVGIGGGPIIMPILMTLYPWENRSLIATCLFIVFVNALSGCAGYARHRRIDYAGGTRFALAAIPGAALASTAHHLFDVRAFQTLFAFFLVLLAFYLLLSSSNPLALHKINAARRAAWRRVLITDSAGETFDFYANDNLGVAMNLALGCLVGFLGIGGGVLQVPVLLYLLYYPVHIATATSHFVTLITCGAALVPHVILGNIHYGEASWMALGVVAGAQLGVHWARRLKSRTIIDLFTVILFVFAVKLLMG